MRLDDGEAFVPIRRDANGRIVPIPLEFGYDGAIREAEAARRVQAAFGRPERVGTGWRLAGCALIIGMWEIGCYLGRLILGWLA